MYNIAISLGAGLVAFFILWLSGLLKAYESSLPALIVAMGLYFILARRTVKRVEALFTQAAGMLTQQPPRFDHAIGILKQGFHFQRWQLGIASQINSQIGMILFLKKEFNEAQKYLKDALNWGHWMAGAMLAVIHYKKKQYDLMAEVFELAAKKARKETLAWSLYAYCLNQINRREDAIKVLNRGIKKIKDNDKLKQNLLSLQNEKKMKMRQLYGEQWYQFHLDHPPIKMVDSPFSGMSNKRRRPFIQ